MSDPKMSLQESVGEALRFVRANWRFVGAASAAGALAMMGFGFLAMSAPPLALPLNLAMMLAQACVYAAFLAAMLYGAPAARERWFGYGVRVLGSMAIIMAFMFLVLLVVSLPLTMVLFSGPLGPYMPELQQAGADQAQVWAVMTRFAQENPGALLAAMIVYGVIVLLITSRLFLAAPASVDAGRIVVFSTWGWTKGALWRIAGARLLLLAPANVLAAALGYLAGGLLGLDPLAPTMGQTGTVAYLVYVGIAAFFSFSLFSSLEAGLSADFYRRLKPAQKTD